MTRVVWLVLHDGRSVVAGCGATTRDSLETALADPGRTLVLTSDHSVEQISAETVRDFIIFDAKKTLPREAAIYRLVHV